MKSQNKEITKKWKLDLAVSLNMETKRKMKVNDESYAATHCHRKMVGCSCETAEFASCGQWQSVHHRELNAV